MLPLDTCDYSPMHMTRPPYVVDEALDWVLPNCKERVRAAFHAVCQKGTDSCSVLRQVDAGTARTLPGLAISLGALFVVCDPPFGGLR